MPLINLQFFMLILAPLLPDEIHLEGEIKAAINLQTPLTDYSYHCPVIVSLFSKTTVGTTVICLLLFLLLQQCVLRGNGNGGGSGAPQLLDNNPPLIPSITVPCFIGKRCVSGKVTERKYGVECLYH